MEDANHRPRGCSSETEYSDDSRWDSIGMLFEGLHPTITKGFLWESSLDSRVGEDDRSTGVAAGAMRNNFSEIEWERRTTRRIDDGGHSGTTTTATRSNTASSVVVCAVVRCIDDHPGAVASGHYVWPSSLSLCDYLVSTSRDPYTLKKELHNCVSSSRPQEEGISQSTPNERILPRGLATNKNNISSRTNRSSRSSSNRRRSHNDTSNIRVRHAPIRSILELGCGSGILSMVASQVFGDTLQVVVVTDHDPTALERAKENHESTMATLCRGLGSQRPIRTTTTSTSTTSSSHCRTEFLALRWGSVSDWQRIVQVLKSREKEESIKGGETLVEEHHQHDAVQLQSQSPAPPPASPAAVFDLVLGSDLIDRAEVVEPLFCTVHAALGNNTDTGTTTAAGTFLLSQSFVYDLQTEAEIDRACHRFQLVRRVLKDEILTTQGLSTGENQGVVSQNYVKIQEFRRRL